MTKYFITGGSGFIGSHFHDSIPQSSIVNFDLVEPKIHLN
jgi:nucleoside-diphosphate-sugar epimerase